MTLEQALPDIRLGKMFRFKLAGKDTWSDWLIKGQSETTQWLSIDAAYEIKPAERTWLLGITAEGAAKVITVRDIRAYPEVVTVREVLKP